MKLSSCCASAAVKVGAGDRQDPRRAIFTPRVFNPGTTVERHSRRLRRAPPARTAGGHVLADFQQRQQRGCCARVSSRPSTADPASSPGSSTACVKRGVYDPESTCAGSQLTTAGPRWRHTTRRSSREDLLVLRQRRTCAGDGPAVPIGTYVWYEGNDLCGPAPHRINCSSIHGNTW